MIEGADGAAGFSAPYRVRFDEAGSDEPLRTSSDSLRYAQDLAWVHSLGARLRPGRGTTSTA